MIAIVGSKGGCGKTTTTLGLAGAYARADQQVLAIDGDQQLPDLHIIAGVNREPTIASLDGSEDVGSVAQEIPEWPGVSILPGPKPAESADIGRTLEHLDTVDAEVLIDCPSGAGPDVTDALSAADRCVVVTTDRGESIKDAQTTIDIAKRLDVPIAGAIVTKCEAAPDSVTQELDIPVLATIPHSETPLSDQAALDAYDQAVRTIRSTRGGADGSPEDGEPAVQPGNRIPLGVDDLDVALGGGVPAGSIIALEADPGSQSEHILHSLTAMRGTLYVSTDRSELLVREGLAADIGDANSPAVREISASTPITEMEELLSDLPEGSNVVIDAVDPLEDADRSAYLGLLDGLKQRLLETDSIALLHGLSRPEEPAHRHLTHRVADAVFSVEAGTEQDIDVTKFRPDTEVKGPVTLDSLPEESVEAAADDD